MYKFTIFHNGKKSYIAELVGEDKLTERINSYLNLYAVMGYCMVSATNLPVGYLNFMYSGGYRYVFQKRNWLTILTEIVLQVEKMSEQTVEEDSKPV